MIVDVGELKVASCCQVVWRALLDGPALFKGLQGPVDASQAIVEQVDLTLKGFALRPEGPFEPGAVLLGVEHLYGVFDGESVLEQHAKGVGPERVLGREDAVTVFLALVCAEQAGLFIEPHFGGTHAGHGGEFADLIGPLGLFCHADPVPPDCLAWAADFPNAAR